MLGPAMRDLILKPEFHVTQILCKCSILIQNIPYRHIIFKLVRFIKAGSIKPILQALVGTAEFCCATTLLILKLKYDIL